MFWFVLLAFALASRRCSQDYQTLVVSCVVHSLMKCNGGDIKGKAQPRREAFCLHHYYLYLYQRVQVSHAPLYFVDTVLSYFDKTIRMIRTMATFMAHYKLPLHVVMLILVHVAIGLSTPAIFFKNQPRTRASTIAIGMVTLPNERTFKARKSRIG